MAKVPELIVNVQIEGQPACCRKLCEAGWIFAWEPGTSFVSASHPLGGKSTVLQVCRIGRSDFDVDEIGKAIETMLNGGNTK